MSKWVDYDAIDYRNDRLHDKSEEFLNGVIYMAQRIEEAPSIEIVRCQDCKHWVYHFNGCARNPCTEPWYATDGCTYGERREP